MWELSDGMSLASLYYLANVLVDSELVETKQHYTSIQKYIDYPSDYPLKNQYSENTDIDNPNEPKPLPKENKRIDKAITKLKLERDDNLKDN
jgi:hypothetical protein